MTSRLSLNSTAPRAWQAVLRERKFHADLLQKGPGLDGRQRPVENIREIVVGRHIGDLEVLGLVNVMTEPVMTHQHVPCAMLIDRVFEERQCSLIIAEQVNIGL